MGQQPRSHRRRIAAALAATAAALSALVASAGAAHAASVPFTDSSASGYIGLCNAAGHQITSGSIDEIPLAVRAVSSTPAPAGYTVRGGVKATLYAYQPIKGIDAGNWSGQAITGSTFFSNPDHPMAQATVLDYSMKSFLGVYPAQWDGLIQLRMAYGAPGKPQYDGTYPTAVLRITGSTWQVVQGGAVDCSDGRTKPVEELALPASRFRSASAAIAASSSAAIKARTASDPPAGEGTAAGGSRTPAPQASGSTRPGAQGSGTAVTHGGGAAASTAPSGHAAGASTPASGDGSGAVVLLAVLAALALAAGAFWALRRRAVAG